MASFAVANVSTQGAALRKILSLIEKGSYDPIVRRTALQIIEGCDSRDDLCELQAIYDAVKHGTDKVDVLRRGFKYVADPRTADFYTGARRILTECEIGSCGGDCLPYDTLVLRRDYRLVPLAEIQIGDVIFGDGAWTTVTNRWDKGEKDLIAIDLGNGSTLRVTEDHRLFRVPKTRQGYAGPREGAEEIRAAEVRPGDDLLTGSTIPFGAESMDLDLAWLLGAYIADGWSEENRCFISGKDGHPKEEQKRRVQRIAEARGWNTRWHERYIAINDRDTATWLGATGKRAPQKHVPSGLNYDEKTIRSLLSGLMADACVRENATTHGTTSSLLAMQLRVIYRMLGQSTHVCRVDDHGGLGSNPIYRVTPRDPNRGRGAKPHARVRAISEIDPEPVMDIETDLHRFYLPETDLVVHNCDDHTVLVASLCAALGFKVGARAWGPDPKRDLYSHVYAIVRVPKRGPWPKGYTGHGMDTTVVKADGPGWEPPKRRAMTAWLEDD